MIFAIIIIKIIFCNIVIDNHVIVKIVPGNNFELVSALQSVCGIGCRYKGLCEAHRLCQGLMN